MPCQTKRLGQLACLGAAFALVACTADRVEQEPAAAPAATSTSKVKLPEYPRTRKPGAAVSFKHAFEAKPEVDQLTTVEITVRDDYSDGTLSLTASGDDSLIVFGPTASMTASMAGTAEHVWRVSFEPKSEGVHYLNIVATVEEADLFPMARSHAIRIEVGDVAPSKTAAEPTNGEMAVILEAEETTE
ncbi:MAG: hypothetical protein AAFW65_01840 [Pseudomonadota bacterium]